MAEVMGLSEAVAELDRTGGDRVSIATAASWITDLGVLEPDPSSLELTLTQLHHGVSVEHVREATGWELKMTEVATSEELGALRELVAR
ncbi:MAG TPA: hypothetical protein VG186_09230 [Solirubrobacteraceae bacterium]|jgi:acyl CoA:acetate/3-ketoacid CoA transferase beta subunit|nr:hypothetical protein [Solirubrobacteraceae bacterium]